MSQRTFQPGVPINSIICPSQVREYFDDEAQAGLDATVRERGVEVPILLNRKDGKFYLLDGARRLRAAKAAGLTTIPAMIDDRVVEDVDAMLTQVILNCQREDLTSLEKAKAIDAAMNLTQASASQIAAKLGMSGGMVTRLLSQLTLPEPIQQRIARGEIPLSSAYELSRITDPEKQAHLAEQVAAGTISRDAISDSRKPAKPTRKPKSERGNLPRVTAKLAGNRSVTVVSQNLTFDTFITALEDLLASARKARTDNLALTTFCQVLTDKTRS